MKIETNQGECELTAEMVCRGMVLLGHDGEPVTLLEGGAGLWSVKEWTRGGLTPPLADCWVFCLGCDPTIASREACERYGVHGNAAAHGFARLRGGGAVDLRGNEVLCFGMVFDVEDGPVRRIVVGEDWSRAKTMERLCDGTPMRFVGLDMRRASAEDVRRLCCATRDARGYLCTLAIGDHDTHEDLATGVKWKATAPSAGEKGRSSVDVAIANILARFDSAAGRFNGSPGAIRSILTACDLHGEVHRSAVGVYRVTLDRADSVLCQTLAGWLADNSPTDAVFEVVSSLAGLDSGCNPGLCGHLECQCGALGPNIADHLRATDCPVVLARRFKERAAEPGTAENVQARLAREMSAAGEFRFDGSGDFYPNRLRGLTQVISENAGGLYVPDASIKAQGNGFRFSESMSGLRWTGPYDSCPALGFLNTDTDTRITIRPDEFRCSCGATNPEHAEACKAPFWMREGSAAAWARMPDMEAAAKAGREAMIGASILGLFVFLRRLWDASPEGLLVARDAAVAQAIADVPEGCDATGWANVVRATAADAREVALAFNRPKIAVEAIPSRLGHVRPALVRYVAARREGFGADAASQIASAGRPLLPGFYLRLFPVYEAGRRG